MATNMENPVGESPQWMTLSVADGWFHPVDVVHVPHWGTEYAHV